MNQADISIGICAYNARDTLVQAMDSVFRQSTGWRELIVLDDGSTDGTADVALAQVKRHGLKARVLRQPNQGIGVARNRILAEARGALLAFVDADDVWHPQKLERQMACLDRHPQWGAVVSKAWGFGAGKEEKQGAEAVAMLAPIPQAASYADLPRQLLMKNFDFPPVSVLWHAQVLRNFGGYAEERNGEDFWPFLAMTMQGIPLGFTDEKLYGQRTLEGSLSRNPKNHYTGAMARLRAIAHLLEKHAQDSSPLDAEQRALLAQGRERFLKWAIYGVRMGYPSSQRSELAYPLIRQLQKPSDKIWEWLKLKAPRTFFRH